MFTTAPSLIDSNIISIITEMWNAIAISAQKSSARALMEQKPEKYVPEETH